MRRCVIYARYSSEKQTEQSIEGQLRVCYEYAQRNDLIVVKEYIDRAMTGTNDLRRDFQKMLSDSEKTKEWDICLVYALDRFGRNAVEQGINKYRLQKTGKIVISATQRTSRNIDGSLNFDGIILVWQNTIPPNYLKKLNAVLKSAEIKDISRAEKFFSGINQ